MGTDPYAFAASMEWCGALAAQSEGPAARQATERDSYNQFG